MEISAISILDSYANVYSYLSWPTGVPVGCSLDFSFIYVFIASYIMIKRHQCMLLTRLCMLYKYIITRECRYLQQPQPEDELVAGYVLLPSLQFHLSACLLARLLPLSVRRFSASLLISTR